MAKNTRESFFTRLRWERFKTHINWEIFNCIGAHLRGEKDCGYSFTTDQEMDGQTERLNVPGLLDTVEGQIANMPRFYGKAFRFVLHRDLREFLEKYERLARRGVQLPDDQRVGLIAPRRLELSQ